MTEIIDRLIAASKRSWRAARGILGRKLSPMKRKQQKCSTSTAQIHMREEDLLEADAMNTDEKIEEQLNGAQLTLRPVVSGSNPAPPQHTAKLCQSAGVYISVRKRYLFPPPF